MELHGFVIFTSCGNVKILRDSVTFRERKCQVTFPSYYASRFPLLFVSVVFLETDLQLFATSTKAQTQDDSLNNSEF